MPEVAFLTKVRRGREEALRNHLRALQDGAGALPPFGELAARTHFARFVVIASGEPHLLFTSRFDGSERAYLSDLAATDEAIEIWEYCAQPRPLDNQSLRAYLLRDRSARIPPSYVVCVLKDTDTVKRINGAMSLQRKLSDFALEAQDMNPIDLAHAFRQLRAVREIAEP